MPLAPARRSHVRRFIYGGLAAAGAVAVGLVFIFMLGQSGSGADKRGSFQNAGSGGGLPTAQITVMSEGESDAPAVFHQEESNGFTITTTVKIEGLGGNTAPTVVDAAVVGASAPSTTITAATEEAVPIAHVTTAATVEDAAEVTAAAIPETNVITTAVHNEAAAVSNDASMALPTVDSVASADVATAEEAAAAAGSVVGTFSQVSIPDIVYMYRGI